MKFISAFVILAATLVGAMDTTTDSTTTLTSTLTMTMTITKCNADVLDCPYATPTVLSEVSTSCEEVETYPAYNTTVVAPTGGPKNHTSPTLVTATSTAYTGSESTAPALVTDSGAGSLYFNSGLLLGVVAAGVALL